MEVELLPEQHVSMFSVFDGHGGRQVADLCSENVVSTTISFAVQMLFTKNAVAFACLPLAPCPLTGVTGLDGMLAVLFLCRLSA